MGEITFNINGKEYTLEEVMSVYEFWQCYKDTNDINDALTHIIEFSSDRELSAFVKAHLDTIRSQCIEHLNTWHNIQSNSLNSWYESIFDFALQLVDCIYYDQEGNLPF